MKTKGVVIGLVALGIVVLPADGAVTLRRQPCHGAITATLASGRFHSHLRECAPHLVSELVRAIESSPHRDEPYNARLAEIVAFFRDPSVFDAAFAVAQDRTASTASRVVALQALVAQFMTGVSVTPLGAEGNEWLRGVFPGQQCPNRYHFTDLGGYWVDNGNRPEDAKKMVRLTRDLAQDAAESAGIRGLAACLQREFPEEAIPFPTDSISVAYRCDNDFDVRNRAARPTVLQIEVEGTDEVFDVNVDARQDRWFSTFATGPVRVKIEGHLVGRIPNEGRPCPMN